MSDQKTQVPPENTELHKLLELHEQLILKAWSDPAFKAEVIKDPAKAVEKLFGIKIPSFIKLKVLEESADTRYITIPYRAAEGDRPLADDELENVAGGASASLGGPRLSPMLVGVGVAAAIATPIVRPGQPIAC